MNSPVVRRSVFRGIGVLSLAVSLVSLSGCGDAHSAANAAAQDNISQARQDLLANQLDTAQSDIASAASNTDVSSDVAAEVQAVQGQIKMAKARQLLVKAEDVEINVSRLLGEVRLATSQIAAAQQQIQSDANLDPSAAVDLLKTHIADAQGSDAQSNWPTPPSAGGTVDAASIVPVRSLAALDAEIARLQTAVQSNRDQAKANADQRTQALDQADQLQQKSLSDTGKQSVDDVTAAADKRRAGADLAIEIDKLDAGLVHLNADLAVDQAQHDVVQKSIDDYNAQIDSLQRVWKIAQLDMDKEKQAIQTLAGPAPAESAPPAGDLPQSVTIADESADLKRLTLQLRDLRDQAATELKDAIRDFKSAGSAGDQVRMSFSDQLNSPRTTQMETMAIQQLEETFSGSGARFRAAEAEQELAVNYADAAMIASQVKSAMTAAQTALGSDAPAAIADCLAAVASPSSDDLALLADEQFKNAMDDFDNQNIQTLQNPGAEDRKTMALVGKMISAYGARQLSLSMSAKPVAGRTPKELQDMIDDLANQVAQRDPSALPAIPYTLAPPAATPQ
jgi:hypothetical protein